MSFVIRTAFMTLDKRWHPNLKKAIKLGIDPLSSAIGAWTLATSAAVVSNKDRKMPQFECRCGHTIVVHPPSQVAGYLVWDRDVDLSMESRRKEIHGFLQAVATDQRQAFLRYFYGSSEAAERLSLITDADVIEDILSKHDRYTRLCFRCPECGRLSIQAEPGSNSYQSFALDDG